MYQLLQTALRTASQVFDDVEGIRHHDTLPNGTLRFAAARKGHKGRLFVSLPPKVSEDPADTSTADLEWRAESKSYGSRVFQIQGLTIPHQEQSTEPPCK
jgi:hypothetical protein